MKSFATSESPGVGKESLPVRGAWIEILPEHPPLRGGVAPRAGSVD